MSVLPSCSPARSNCRACTNARGRRGPPILAAQRGRDGVHDSGACAARRLIPAATVHPAAAPLTGCAAGLRRRSMRGCARMRTCSRSRRSPRTWRRRRPSPMMRPSPSAPSLRRLCRASWFEMRSPPPAASPGLTRGPAAAAAAGQQGFRAHCGSDCQEPGHCDRAGRRRQRARRNGCCPLLPRCVACAPSRRPPRHPHVAAI